MNRLTSRSIRGALTPSKPLHSSFYGGIERANHSWHERPASSAKLGGRLFHTTTSRLGTKPFLLADIGEGITECQIVDWFVKPGDKVEQFDRICEVQSDKASVEITSRFDGTISKLHYNTGDMATVGQPLVDINTDGSSEGQETAGDEAVTHDASADEPTLQGVQEGQEAHSSASASEPNSTANLGASISVAKNNEDVVVPLTARENQMFQTMTKSLAIPQFLYSHSVDTSALHSIRQRANTTSRSSLEPGPKITALSLIMKAISQAFLQFPKMNAHLDIKTDPLKPRLVLKTSHNFGIAVDTPEGLLVPVIKGVERLSVTSIAAEITRLSELAKAGRLQPDDFRHGTFIVSNIGSIGGNVVSPVIVPPMVGIVGIGRERSLPVFNIEGDIVPQRQTTVNWSADHRVLDGATLAKCAETVARYLENMEQLEILL